MVTNYNILKKRKRVFLSHIKIDKVHIKIYMEPLDEQVEVQLDRMAKKHIEGYYTTSVHTRIPIKDIINYGDIDINSKEDIDFIKKAPIIDDNNGFYMKSGLDYELGLVFSDEEGIYREYQSWDKVKLFKLKHCLINKAPKIIIYKERTLMYAGKKLQEIIN